MTATRLEPMRQLGPLRGAAKRRGPVALGTVLVTGASSGIGAATAAALAERGFHVLAGVRRVDDALDLVNASSRVEPVLLDLTDDHAIAACAERIARLPNGLAGLVNNAGTLSVGPVELISSERWDAVLRVNVLGTIELTRAALPGLLAARGRVINVSSPTGRLALPMLGPYSVSKFALEAFNDTLRREVRHLGVDVVCVTPGPISTPIFDKGLIEGQEMMDGASEAARERYGAMATSAIEAGHDTKHNGHTSAEAAAVIVKALTVRRPRTRYVMGIENRLVGLITRALPDRALDAVVARFATHPTPH